MQDHGVFKYVNMELYALTVELKPHMELYARPRCI
jgi:hypothetical protein